VDIIFIARHTDVQERFRQHAAAKLTRIEKLDNRAISVDVEVCTERNPRQSDHKERVELTVISKGPPIRAEAAAEDRFAALDMALAKLESRLRRACERRKDRHSAHAAIRLGDLPPADLASDAESPAIRLEAGGGLLASNGAQAIAGMATAADEADARSAGEPDGEPEDLLQIETQGQGPLVVREKFHAAIPMNIDQALFEMEMVGHDFFLFTDAGCGMPSLVYRRRGYQYGVIRLVEEHAPLAASADTPDIAESPGHPALGKLNGQVKKAAPATEPIAGVAERAARPARTEPGRDAAT
jgi:ribosomal subunit interface protein